MKTKLLLFLLLLGLLVTGCQNDILQDEPAVKGKVLPEVDAEDLALAMLWYEEHRIEQFSTRTGGQHPLFEASVPEWETCFAGEDATCKTVETYLNILNRGLFLTPDVAQVYEETGDLRYLSVLTRMVIMTPKESNEIIGFYMTIVPSKDYLEKTDFKPFTNNTYTVRDKDLDGYVLYHQLDGTFINGWIYEQGKITTAIYGKASDSSVQTRAGTMICIPTYSQTCTDWYSSSGGDTYYTGTTCDSPVYNGSDCYTTGGSGASGGGVGDFGGGGANPLSGLPMSLNLKKLFTRHSIGDSGIKLLNQVFDEMISDCVYKAIFDYLVTKEKFGTIVISPNMMELASISTGGSQFKFADDSPLSINVENVEHEFLHMLQIRYSTSPLTFDNIGMMEFEGCLFRDIYRFIQIKGDWKGKEETDWACWGNSEAGSGANKESYMAWLKELTNSGKSFPTKIGDQQFSDWSVKFGNYNRAYNASKGIKYGQAWKPVIPFIGEKINMSDCFK